MHGAVRVNFNELLLVHYNIHLLVSNIHLQKFFLIKLSAFIDMAVFTLVRKTYDGKRPMSTK